MPYHNRKMSSFKSYLKVWISKNQVINLSKGNAQFNSCIEINKMPDGKINAMTSCVDKTSKH